MLQKKRISCVAVVALLVGCSAVAAADTVTEWNVALSEMISTEGVSNQMGNRALAMMHVAMYDAVNSISREYEPYIAEWPAPRVLPQEVAAAAAARHILTTLFPGGQAGWTELYEDQTAGVRSRGLKRVAEMHGRRVADLVLAWREDDGSAGAADVPYPDGTLPGEWRRTGPMPPVFPGWGQVLPFAMQYSEHGRLNGPPPLNSYEYARDYNEVKLLGAKNSTVRTDYQSETAQFWRLGIPEMWNSVARQVAVQEQLSLVDSARLFALLNVAMADAGICGWEMKYYYGFWRPVTAIRMGAMDANDATEPDAAWEPYLMTPQFPEYVSGHSTTCAVAATILARVIGTDAYGFTVECVADPALPARTFDSFWAAAKEAGISRIYGGIHYQFSNAEGLEAGRWLGRYIVENYMLSK